jgi:hypothetical protein
MPLNLICVDCSPGGSHPIFTKELDFFAHRFKAHDEAIPAEQLPEPLPLGSAERIENMLTDLAAKSAQKLTELDARIKAVETENVGAALGNLDTRIKGLEAARLDENASFDQFVKDVDGHFTALDSSIAGLTSVTSDLDKRLLGVTPLAAPGGTPIP